MNKAIEWVKKSVGLCSEGYRYEKEEIQNLFLDLQSEYENLDVHDRKTIENIIKTQFLLPDQIYILSYFVQLMDIHSFRDMLMDCLLKVDFDYYTLSMLQLQINVDIPDCYAKKRKFNKKNTEKIAEIIGVDNKYIPVNKRNTKRIVIITEQILGLNHAPTKIVLNYALAIKKMGYEVIVFACPSNAQLDPAIWYRPFAMQGLEKYGNGMIELEYENENIGLYQINMNEGGLLHYKLMIDFIYEFNPIFVYSIGSFNPVFDIITKFTTVVAQKVTLGLPVTEAQILLKSVTNKNILFDEENYLADKQKVFHTNKVEHYFEDSGMVYTREELGLPKNRFLLVVVGNRLDEECGEEFVSFMQEILADNPQAYFVIIGNAKKFKDLVEKTISKEDVHFCGYCNDLIGTLKVMDLYVNPKRKGGGFSSVMSLIAGVPVVTMPGCDVSYNAGDDFVVSDYTEMKSVINKYYADSDFYKKQVEKGFEITKDKTKENMLKTMSQKIDDIISFIKEREE